MEPFSGQSTPAESFIEPESITSKDDTQAGVIVSEEAVTMLNMEESANPSSEASEEADVGEEGEQEGEIEEGDEGLQSWIEEPGDDDQDRARIATGDGDLGDIMDLEYEEEEEEGPDGFDQIKDWSQTADDGEAEGERDIEERARQDDYEDHSPLQLGIVEDKEDYEATDDQDDDFDRRPEFYTLPERYRDSRQQQQQQ